MRSTLLITPLTFACALGADTVTSFSGTQTVAELKTTSGVDLKQNFNCGGCGACSLCLGAKQRSNIRSSCGFCPSCKGGRRVECQRANVVPETFVKHHIRTHTETGLSTVYITHPKTITTTINSIETQVLRPERIVTWTEAETQLVYPGHTFISELPGKTVVFVPKPTHRACARHQKFGCFCS